MLTHKALFTMNSLVVGFCWMQLLQRAEDLLVTVSQTLNMELTVEQLVQHFSETKNELELKHNRIADEGLQLVDRLNQPILIDDRYTFSPVCISLLSTCC